MCPYLHGRANAAAAGEHADGRIRVVPVGRLMIGSRHVRSSGASGPGTSSNEPVSDPRRPPTSVEGAGPPETCGGHARASRKFSFGVTVWSVQKVTFHFNTFVTVGYKFDNRGFWLSAHNCQIPTPTFQNLELEQQIRIFEAA
jgi:hypothetical protein